MDKSIINEFVCDLYTTSSFDDSFSVLERYINKLGFDGVLYTFIPSVVFVQDNALAPVFKISDSYCPEFIEHYMEAGYGEHDFTIKAISEGEKQPIDWWEEEKKKQLSANEKQIIITAREDYNVQNGITIPTLTGYKGIAGGSFISSDNDDLYQKLKVERLDTLRLFVKMFHDKVMASKDAQYDFIFPILASLSETEKKVLRYIVSGQPMKLIEDNIGVKYKYATTRVESLRNKFGNISRDQLAYYAGLLNILEYI